MQIEGNNVDTIKDLLREIIKNQEILINLLTNNKWNDIIIS